MNITPSKTFIKNIFWGLAGILLVFMLLMSRKAGISGDEYFHVDQAEKVFYFYSSLGQDTTAIDDKDGDLKYYGQSLDNLVHIFNTWFNIEDIYQSRHFFISFTGWILVLFCGLIASLLFGWQAGILAMLIAFFSPKLLGHSFNNPKDLPFATAYIFSIYFILKFIKELPRIKFITLLFIALGIAWAISLRIGGVILVPYLFMFVGIHYLTEKSFYSKTGFLKSLKTVGILSAVVIAGYFIGLILWPYALKNPLKNPLEALKQMTNYGMGINQLFEGEIQMSKNLPWYYGLKYILITNPLIVFIGFAILLFITPFKKYTKTNYLFTFYLFFAFAFPLAYIIYQGSNIYGGWRHLLWTYGPLVVLSAGGFEYFLSKKNIYIKYGTLVVIVLLMIHPVVHTFKNHPHQYVYYNQLVGGVKGAYGEYEMDYYYHSLREGADWLIENEIGTDTITVTTNHSRIIQYYFRNYPQVKVTYSRYYEKGKNEWDYAIWANTHITPHQLEKGYWPPKETIHTMDVDGMPIGAVIKRISNEDYLGFEALNKRRLAEAKNHFRSFLKEYPENEEVLEGYARAMLMEQNYDSTIVYADKSLEYNPRQLGALLLKASAHNTQKEYQAALETANAMDDVKEDFPEGLYQKGYALKNLNKPNDALSALQKAISYKNDYQQAYYLMGEILSNYKNYKKAIEVYSKVLEQKPNDFAATIYIARNNYLAGNEQAANKILENDIPGNRQNRLEVVALKCRMALDKNDLNTAANYLNMARNINSNADLFVLRARFYLVQNNKENAEAMLEKAVELDATNREAKELLTSLQKAPTTVAAQQNETTQQKKDAPKSIMFQKPKKKKNSPLTIPSR